MTILKKEQCGVAFKCKKKTYPLYICIEPSFIRRLLQATKKQDSLSHVDFKNSY